MTKNRELEINEQFYVTTQNSTVNIYTCSVCGIAKGVPATRLCNKHKNNGKQKEQRATNKRAFNYKGK